MPVSLGWPQLSEALNCYFHAQTGRGLTPQNLDYLGRKLLSIGNEEDLSQKVVTRQQVCKVSTSYFFVHQLCSHNYFTICTWAFDLYINT